MSRAVTASLLALALSVASSAAVAQGVPRRVVGFGAGLALGGERTSVNTSHWILQPLNVEVRVPLTARFELGAHVPVGNVIYGNIAESGQRFVWFDVFATWYPLRDAGGLFVAPGLGLLYGSNEASRGVGLEIPARLGWEFTGVSRSFATALSVRPWVDVVFPSGNVDVGTRYGALVELTLIGYVTR